jgi:hypothetical protein
MGRRVRQVAPDRIPHILPHLGVGMDGRHEVGPDLTPQVVVDQL